MPRLHLDVLGLKIDVTGLSKAETVFFSEQWNYCVDSSPLEPSEKIERKEGTWERAYEHLTQHITRKAVAHNLGNYLMFHAAGLQLIGTRDVIAFVASSGTGKSTLTATLGTKMGYLSDEVVALDTQLTVFPLQKPVSLIGRSHESFKGHLGPDQLELVTELQTPAKLASIVVLNRVTSKVKPSLSPLVLEDALITLAPQLSGLGLMNDGLDRLCKAIARTGGAYELTYTDAADLEPSFFEAHLVENSKPVQTAWHHLPRVEANNHGFEFARGDFFDAVMTNGRIFVLDQGQLRKLGDLASEIWLRLPSVGSKSELLEHLEARFGTHDEAEKILEQMLKDLEIQRLIVKTGS